MANVVLSGWMTTYDSIMADVTRMLTALGPDNTRLTIAEPASEPQLRALSRDGLLRCANCGHRVLYKHGAVRRAHFAHTADAACIDRYGEPDSLPHQAMKLAMWRWLRDRYPEASVEMEVVIETGQRSDVLITWPGGQRLAVEVQLSPLSAAGWLERHDLYQSCQVRDVWLLHVRWLRHLTAFTQPADDEYLAPLGGTIVPARLGDLERAMARHDQQLRYLDAESGAVYFLADIMAVRDAGDPLADDGDDLRATLLTTPLADLRLRLRRGRLVWLPLEEALERLTRARQAEAERLAQSEQDAAARLHFYQQRRLQQLAENRGVMARHPIWHQLVRAARLDPDPDRLHPLFGVIVPGSNLIRVDPRLWQACIYYRLIHNQPQRKRDAAWIGTYLRQTFGDSCNPNIKTEWICEYFLAYLADLGILRRQRQHYIVVKNIWTECPCALRIDAYKALSQWNADRHLARYVVKDLPQIDPEHLVGPPPDGHLSLWDRPCPPPCDWRSGH
jgi:hypothetical protein